MSEHREKMVETIEKIVEARDIIFTEIVNLAMSGEMSHLQDAFDINDEYCFTLKHFEAVEDINVKKLVVLCKQMEETTFSLMKINGITENNIDL